MNRCHVLQDCREQKKCRNDDLWHYANNDAIARTGQLISSNTESHMPLQCKINDHV